MKRALFALAAALCAASPTPSAQPAAPESSAIIVVTDNNYPPYVFVGADGELKGIIPDQWRAWEKATGRKAALRGMDWGKALDMMARGEADVIDTIFANEQRKRLYIFSRPYATLEVPIFMHSSVSGIATVSDLRGFKVAVKQGDAAIAWLNERGIVDLVEYPSYESIVDAAARLDVRVFCVDKPPAEYFLYKYGVDRDFRVGMTLYSGEFHRAVSKDRPELLALVQSGFDAIPKAYYDEIDRRWFGAPIGVFSDSRIPLVAGGVAILAMLVTLFMAYDSRRLRKRIAVATAELRDKILLIESSEAKARAALAEKEILLREVHHRVKNNMQIVSSLVSLQEGTMSDESDRSRFHDLQQRIRSMARVHELLYETSDFASIDLGDYLKRMVEELCSGYGCLAVEVEADPIRIPLEKAMPLALIANELVTNAIKYSSSPAPILVRLRKEGASHELRVRDGGAGPKGDIDPGHGKTMGFVLVHSLTRQLGGTLSFQRGDGFSVTVAF
jgi:two-component sensor histidine kinase/ABC-type amino acid transport substrate-binding protein